MKETILKMSIRLSVWGWVLRIFLKFVVARERSRRKKNPPRDTLPTYIEKWSHWYTALFGRVCHNLSLKRKYISKEVLFKAVSSLTGGKFAVYRSKRLEEVRENYKQKYGSYPPMYITLSPTQACNLKCVGCYSSSDEKSKTYLPYEMLERILNDLYDNMANRFVSISGGEPFMYQDRGKTLFDLFAQFNDRYFMVYTNGILLNEKNCEKLAELGNVTPAISIEGWEKQTDERRGKGTHRKLLENIESLKAVGVPFGISSTVTARNVEVFLNTDIYDYLFEELGATYLWLFQLMPIGRAKDTLPLLINSKQRLALYRIWEEMLTDRKYPIADFWNSAAIVEGCIAYGRTSGYFYINWDGKIMPCVFVPFYEETVYDIYDSGRTLGDALQAPLFKNGREWQKSYGYCNPDKENILMPCSIRDHFEDFKCNIMCPEAKPENEQAEQMVMDPDIEEALIRLEKDLEQLSDKIWQEEYLQRDSQIHL
jgi:MoaA/NifB/PqqE/SkfB family radical SAM enzyme